MSKSVVSISSYLDTLEDTKFTKKSHTMGLMGLNVILKENDTIITPEEALRILAVFEKCMKEDVMSLPHGLSTVLSLLSNKEVIQKLCTEDLFPSALAVLKMLHTMGVFKITENLKYMGIQVVLAYPTEVLCFIIRHHCNEVIEIFEVLKQQEFQPLQEINKTAYYILKGLLPRLPPPEKKKLLEAGLDIWFSDLIPLVIKSKDSVHYIAYLELLETLAEELTAVDYFKHPLWKHNFLFNVSDVTKYPSCIKSHLTNNSEVWHRLWIVLVKLLKLQMTQPCPYGTPIQSMLGVVESGFKVDTHKVQAFQCWDTLIDILSADTSPKCVRYIKLLLIPMKVNNAKTAPTIEAKFHTWWKLINKFQGRLDQFTEEVVITFINFAFGKTEKTKSATQVPATCEQRNLRHLCLQAYAQIVGHQETCNCRVDLPNLTDKFLTKKLLMKNLEQWMYALRKAILTTYNVIYVTSCEDSVPTESMQIICIWNAFVKLIAELPPNGVRNDLFNELLDVLIVKIQVEGMNDNTVFSIVLSLVLSLTKDKDKSIKNMLLQSKTDEDPLHKIIPIVLHPQMAGLYQGYGIKKMVQMLKPLINLFVKSQNIDCLVKNLSQSNNTITSITLWAALADCLTEATVVKDVKLLREILSWPVKASIRPEFVMDQYSSSIWSTLYSVRAKHFGETEVFFENSEHLWTNQKEKSDQDYFRLVVTIYGLKHMLNQNQDVKLLHQYLLMLERLTINMVDYNMYEQIIPVLNDTLVLLLSNLCTENNICKEQAIIALKCVEHVANLINKDNNTKNCFLKYVLNNLTKAVKDMSKVPEYEQLIRNFLARTGELSGIKQESTNVSSRQQTSNETKNNNVTRFEPQKPLNVTTDSGKNVKEFTSPKVKAKKSKKEASIVKTVVENGEEYVVVKSSWKFNPRKLTENQKEKLQRKREDIPALYQDLSQSQDEFKLKSWKTDSQDTFTSASTSNTKSNQTINEDASNILKTISSFDVVPNIMKNMITENDKNHTTKSDTEPPAQTSKNSSKEPVTPKHTKSPRMALKDRVFRNVRNLIEKSSLKNNSSEVNVVERPASDVPMTPPPIGNINNVNLVQSAPTLISADRPSRMKRKPKKFDDTQLFGLKKRRFSHTDTIPNTQNQTETAGTIELINDQEIRSDEKTKRSEDNKDNDTPKANQVTENDSSISINGIKVSTITKDVSSPETQKHLDISTTEIIAIADKVVSVNDVARETQTDYEIECHVKKNFQNKANDFDVQNDEKEHNEPIDFLASQEAQTNKVAKDKNKDSGNPRIMVSNDQIQSMGHKAQIKSGGIVSGDKLSDSNIETESNNNNKEMNIIKTPVAKTRDSTQKSCSTSKKSNTRKSRLEKELAIDMVEGHPFLKIKSDKRVTRKKLVETETTDKRKSVPEDVTRTKTPSKSPPKSNKKLKETNKSSPSSSQTSVTIEETQEKSTPLVEPPCSEDIIESSQDSTYTTISVKSTKRTQRIPIVTIEKLENINHVTGTQNLLQDSVSEVICEENVNKTGNQDLKDDIELPRNKTAEADKDVFELTENMDTEPLIQEKLSDDVIEINDENTPITINSEKSVRQDTQEIAEADTQPNNPADFIEFESTEKPVESQENSNTAMDVTEPMTPCKFPSQHTPNTEEDSSKVTAESKRSSGSKLNCEELDTDVCSPFKDDAERKQDFLNNTSEISPIKIQSPDKEKSPEKQEETSSDYMVVKLSSPVHSNGEPYHSGSPEFFTDDKVSPEKRDQSPPRTEASTSHGSPSSSLSLKKNKPQAKRSGGRAAHMLGLLCIPDSLKHSDRVEPEEPKKISISTPVRRNLRVLYNAVEENNDTNLEEEEQVNFLKLKKTLPSIDSSPSVPILKRKLIIDENSGSPAGKRKRVSFHDPPVSTTVSVQKYIEPALNRSPSSSHKRPITRNLTKSPKRLDTAFKLDTVLSKALESFKEPTDSLSNDTIASLDVTPAVEVVNTNELNDTDPICAALVDCKDPIENVALELSSPTMKDLLIKELDGKVATVGDLAKLTELEVNRLCIKAPKIQVAKKVLSDYAFNLIVEDVNVTEIEPVEDGIEVATEMEVLTEPETKVSTIDTQTDVVMRLDVATQSGPEAFKPVSTQTSISNEHVSVQTVESGSKSTSEIITSCLEERPDFLERLSELLPPEKVVDIFAKQTDFNHMLGRVLDLRNQQLDLTKKASTELDFIKQLVCQRFGSKDLIKFCQSILGSVHEKLD